MKDLWERLEAWGEKSGAGSLRLRKGATEKQIAAAEKKMKLQFPKDFRASLLLHDGMASDEGEPGHFSWLPGCDPLKPLSAMVQQWVDEREMDDGDEGDGEVDGDDVRLKAALHHEKRIPIAGSDYWDGDNTYIDFAPGSKGTAGQVITYTSECDLTVLGTSFRNALERYVSMLESGKLVWHEENGVVPKGKTDWNGNDAEAFAKMK